MKREPLLSEEYFDHSIAFKKMAISRDEIALATNPKQFVNPEIIAVSLFNRSHGLLMAEYSRGYSIDDMRKEFPKVIETWENLKAIDQEGAFELSFKKDIDDYVKSLWLFSQAYLLGVEPAVMGRVLTCIGNEGQDVLFERMVARIAPTLVRKAAKKLVYPKVYQSLYDALDAPADQQAAFMQQFLQQWYKRLSNTGWHDAHKGSGGGGFFGYWCWEAAGVALAFGIDDTSFRDLPYYPTDLADYARAAG